MFKNNLIENCKKGKPKAQLKLYNKYCDAMLSISMRYLKQKDLAEDATQEAFIKAFKNIHNYNGKTTFGAWLKTIVINQSIDHYRKQKYYEDIDKINLELVELERDTWEVSEHITTRDIENSIENLPEKFSTVLKLYLIEGYDHEEISEIISIKANHSRTLLHRGKKLLQKQLKDITYERFA